MIKAKKIGLILEREIQIDAVLKNGVVVTVSCEFIDSDFDRLYLKFPSDKMQLAQYFYEGRIIDVNLDTLDGRRTYSSCILYEPDDGIIVVEFTNDKKFLQKRKVLRIRTTKMIDVKVGKETILMLTIDISAGGCRVLSPVEVKIGTLADAVLRLFPNQPPIEALIKVKNSKYLPVESKYELSVEFVEISEPNKRRITKFCYDTQAAILSGQNKVE